MKILAAERKRALDAAAEWRRMRSNAGGTSSYGPSAGTGPSGDRDSGQGYPAGVDAEDTDVAAAGPAGHGQAGNRQGASRHGHAATRGTGVEAGRPLGDKDGSTDPSWVPPPPGASISDNPARVPMAGGKPHGSAIGRQGGTGHLYGFWRGIIDFPASVAAAINLAVIVADANVMGFGRRMLGRVVGGISSAVLRRELGDEARRFAAGRMRTLSAQIEQSPGFDALPASRQTQLLADIAADIEQSYYNQAGSYFGRQARESADHAAGHAGGVAAHNRQLARQNAAAYQAMEQAAQDNSAELQTRLAREHAAGTHLGPTSTGARTLDRFDWDGAERAYDMIRATNDIEAISKHTGWLAHRVRRVKEHLFRKAHNLDDGLRRFDADPQIANAWGRLQNGQHTPADIQLLEHELFESKFEGIFSTDYRTAHDAANRAGRPSGLE